MERHVEVLSQLWLTTSSYFYFVLFYILSCFSFFLGRETRIPVQQPFMGCSGGRFSAYFAYRFIFYHTRLFNLSVEHYLSCQ
jgi:hypothetical protein